MRRRRRQSGGRAGGPRRVVLVVGALVGEALFTRSRSGRLGGNLVVRCREGHLFTTLWIPGVSVKSLRLGPWRVQRCPVGRHFALVTPVRPELLNDEERQAALEQHDIGLP